MTTTNTPQVTAIELVNALAQNETDRANVLAKLRGKTAEVGVWATKVAELERQIIAKDKASAILNDEVIALKATIARLERELHPATPPNFLDPRPVVSTHIDSDPRATPDKRHLPGTPGNPSPGELANDPRHGGKLPTPPAGNPVPPDSDNDHTQQRAEQQRQDLAKLERSQEREEQRREDAREDRAAVKASLQPPQRHK